ncbi:hypothetical protein KIW84_051149 [Lathyrus oleraceus]|uniref:Retroviral polymerase SH3-like domain-containing protein n=1 Tax=Pisum sativum TaxID=3888 RepID=A0A9D4WLS4_PEA|nr:hypothetical protein KIW84_051149 [Pisum sativum]
MGIISQLNKLGLVRGLPNPKFASNALCEACQKGKFSKTSFKAKIVVSTSRPIELLHIDLFGLVKTASINGKKYGLVIVDDYSQAVNTAYYIHNRISIQPIMGYSEHFKGYTIFNTETRIIEESIHVRFNDKLDPKKSKLVEKFADLKINLSESKDTDSGEKDSEGKAKESEESTKPEAIIDLTHQKKSRSRTSHSEELIMGDKNALVRTRSSFKPSEETILGLTSLIEHTSIDEALLDNEWILAIQEELDQFTRNNVWDLVQKPKGFHVIGTK